MVKGTAHGVILLVKKRRKHERYSTAKHIYAWLAALRSGSTFHIFQYNPDLVEVIRKATSGERKCNKTVLCRPAEVEL